MNDEDAMPPLRDRLARIIFERRSRRLGLICAWDEWPDKSRFLNEADAILAAPGIGVTELPEPEWSTGNGCYGYGNGVTATTGRVWFRFEYWIMTPSEAIDIAAALLAAANKANEGRA